MFLIKMSHLFGNFDNYLFTLKVIHYDEFELISISIYLLLIVSAVSVDSDPDEEGQCDDGECDDHEIQTVQDPTMTYGIRKDVYCVV